MKIQIIAILILITFTLGCISEGSELVNGFVAETEQQTSEYTQVTESSPTEYVTEVVDETVPFDTLRIGAFNIQVFGVTKASKPEVMDVLADIIRTYDVVAIQEIRDSSQTSLPELVDLVNSDGSQYDYVVSERLGRQARNSMLTSIIPILCLSAMPIPILSQMEQILSTGSLISSL